MVGGRDRIRRLEVQCREYSMSDNSQKKVIVGMSGGVDSSVSAYLLQQQGYKVEGLFMKNWEEDDGEEYCTAAADLADAQAVCDKLGIELHTVNFAAEYWDNVFELFLEEYKAGRTPNPDILCNKEIKFKAFLEFAAEDLGADYIATGHYVRRADVNGKSQLLRGLDGNKDQSYFLYTLSHEQIAQSLFPVGELEKPEVRKIAEDLDLITAKKKDSTGICFIGERKFREFLGRYLPAQPGKIVTVDGDEIGQHQGLMYHTLGQRKGLGIGGTKEGSEDPWYVVDKDVENNILVVAQGHDHPRLMSVGLIAQQLHWVDREPLKGTLRCTVKTRYRQTDIPCTVTALDDDRIDVRFDEPVSAVTPGQSAVFYSGEICLGGGIIEQRLPLPAVYTVCTHKGDRVAKNYYDITLALAGICQSARLVQQLAHQGHCDADALHVSLNSVIDLNPGSTLGVFGGSETNLRLGLETLLGVLNASNRQGLNAELTRYTLSLMVLERKLNAAKGAMNTLGDRIAGLQRQLDHFDLQSETLLSAMAGIYVDVISPLGPRIQVTGSPAVLQSPQVQAKVRASLLAGIRAAVLWQQVGGGRLQLMFSRHRLTTQAKQILAHC